MGAKSLPRHTEYTPLRTGLMCLGYHSVICLVISARLLKNKIQAPLRLGLGLALCVSVEVVGIEGQVLVIV